MKSLPRLCYIGEVPIECSYHGSTLLWRLFQNYPSKDLIVIEGIHKSSVERRLPQVTYVHPSLPGISRLLRTRHVNLVSRALYAASSLLAVSLAPRVAYERPDAIITVCHGLYWRVAAKVSSILKLPLHLIVHDHVPMTLWASDRLRSRIADDFGRIYSTSATRLCVSEEMAIEYEQSFGVSGVVLYPSRARVSSNESPLVPANQKTSGGLTGVFAGTVNHLGYVKALAAMARQLARVGGKLVIFGPLSQSEAPVDLSMPNVEFRGLVPATALRDLCRKEADFLYVPMSFDPGDRTNMRLSFPSKLADYTAMGLPLLIHGPEYCSAVRWARKNIGVAEVVVGEDGDELLSALTRLLDPIRREALACEATRVGMLYFSHSAAESVLFRALMNGEPHPYVGT